ncbi:hypothetical protein QJS10_CPB22g01274 [Acorus calamus]|uniref:Uncharacterized protein n=1 Tax=Acorus calamus TaxID=4465 RepID=A0AAV9C229_ACOCL|nr:hypothetical protein QJS10_CPB22g01274 [Acorus calamus]
MLVSVDKKLLPSRSRDALVGNSDGFQVASYEVGCMLINVFSRECGVYHLSVIVR